MRRWFVADLHWGHKNILRFTSRPYKDLEEMREAFVKNWNSVVRKQDRVYVLGDWSFDTVENTKKIMSRLHGDLILVAGNHDRNADVMIKMGFRNVIENDFIKIGGHKVYLSHFPYYPSWWSKLKAFFKRQKLDTRFLHKRIVDDGNFLLHGHVHESYKFSGKQFNVGVDRNNYTPVSEEEVLKWIESFK